MPTISDKAVDALQLWLDRLVCAVRHPEESSGHDWEQGNLCDAVRATLAEADVTPPVNTVRVEIPLDVVRNSDGTVSIMCGNAEWEDGENIYVTQLELSPPTCYVIADVPTGPRVVKCVTVKEAGT